MSETIVNVLAAVGTGALSLLLLVLVAAILYFLLISRE